MAPPPPSRTTVHHHHHNHNHHLLHRITAFLSSDSSHHYFLLFHSFAAAYAPYLLLPLLPLLLYFATTLRLHLLAFFAQLWQADYSRAGASTTVTLFFFFFLLLLAKLWWSRFPRIYLVDYAAVKSRYEYRLTTHHCAKVTRESSRCSLSNMFFQLKVLLKSGLGDDVYGAPYLFKEGGAPTLEAAHEETQLMLFGAVDELLAKTGIAAAAVDILIVAVSMFAPTPSLASHIVSRYKLRPDVQTFNLSGMGCSAGIAALDLARRLLSLPHRRHQSALILGTENTTLNFYPGDERSMLVANCLFRCGAHALLISNYRGDGGGRAAAGLELPPPKMELLETIRTTTAASDRAYKAIFTREDDAGIKGTALGVELMEVAAEAVQATMSRLAAGYMPLRELWKVAAAEVADLWRQREAEKAVAEEEKGGKRRRPYVANWSKAFDHVCLHPGGKAVVEGMGRRLGLNEAKLEASKMALQRFGNTSGSGVWYALAYWEAKERLKGGNKVLQLALGSGFKCNAAVWKVVSDLRRPEPGFSPWCDCIDRYPVAVPEAIDATHPHFDFYQRTEQELRSLGLGTTLPPASPQDLVKP